MSIFKSLQEVIGNKTVNLVQDHEKYILFWIVQKQSKLYWKYQNFGMRSLSSKAWQTFIANINLWNEITFLYFLYVKYRMSFSFSIDKFVIWLQTHTKISCGNFNTYSTVYAFSVDLYYIQRVHLFLLSCRHILFCLRTSDYNSWFEVFEFWKTTQFSSLNTLPAGQSLYGST